MKREILTLLAVGLLAGSVPATAQSTNEPPAYTKLFKNQKEMRSYAIGMNYGQRLKPVLKTQEIDADLDTIVKAFRDSLTGAKLPITESQEFEILNAMSAETQAKFAERRRIQGELNQKESDNFMALNKSASGVITTASGLQYKVLKAGSGDPPKPSDTVLVKFRSTLIDGTEYDSSDKHTTPGTPVEVPVNNLLPGWSEAMSLMSPGSKWRLFIPASLAYGERGFGTLVGPNKAVIIEVELVSIRPAPAVVGAPMTSPIVKVPSAEEMKKGAQIEIIKDEDIEKERLKEARTNK